MDDKVILLVMTPYRAGGTEYVTWGTFANVKEAEEFCEEWFGDPADDAFQIIDLFDPAGIDDD